MSGFNPIVLFWYIFPVLVYFACRFIVSALSLNDRYHVKAPDLAVPFLMWGFINYQNILLIKQSHCII